jgi:hypothetical protein
MIELLRKIAALKRYDPNGQKGWKRSHLTVNVPEELLDELDAFVALNATPDEYAQYYHGAVRQGLKPFTYAEYVEYCKPKVE